MCVQNIVFFTQFVSIKSIIIHNIHIHKHTYTQIHTYEQSHHSLGTYILKCYTIIFYRLSGGRFILFRENTRHDEV